MLKLYEINPEYIDFLSAFEPHLFRNRKADQKNERKYIGIVLSVNGLDYFVPLSSFKQKHRGMCETTDFLKIRDYAVLNLNNMFPAPMCVCSYIDINSATDIHYRNLLRNEYRVIKKNEDKILKNARIVYTHKIMNGNGTGLSKRCNDFLLLEQKCLEWMSMHKSWRP